MKKQGLYKVKHFAGILVCLLFTCSAFSRNTKSKIYQQVDSLYELARNNNNYEDVLRWLRLAEKKAERVGYYSALQKIYNRYGVVHFMKGSLNTAYDYFEKLYRIAVKLRDTTSISRALNNKASVKLTEGKQEEALQIFKKALELHHHEDRETISLWFNIALIYKDLKDYKAAAAIFRHTLVSPSSDTSSLLKSYNNLGIIYREINKPDSAFYFLRKGLYINQKAMSALDETEIYNSLGNLHATLENPDSALYYFKKAVEIAIQNKFRDNILVFRMNVMSQMLKRNQSAQLVSMMRQYRSDYEESENRILAREFFQMWADVFTEAGMYREANEGWVRFYKTDQYLDSINSLDQARNMSSDIAQRLTTVRDSVLTARKMERDRMRIRQQEEDIQQGRERFLFFSVLGAAMLIAMIFAIRLARTKSRLAGELRIQRDKLNEQKILIEVKNKEVTDSINYACQLQKAILPPVEMFEKSFNEYGLLYLPRDIVAGDFYFMEELEKDGITHVIVGVADCTGHGVPGAMVSVVCSNALHRTVNEFKLTQPGKILDKVRELVLETFTKSGEEVNDGMDISLAAITYSEQDEKEERSKLTSRATRSFSALSWSGANNPLWIVGKNKEGVNELTEIKPDKQPIGRYYDPKPFTTQSIHVEKGSVLYFFSDGYCDQFGGQNNKKLKASRLKDFILHSADKGLMQQVGQLEMHFTEWKNDYEQTDDVCLLAVRI